MTKAQNSYRVPPIPVILVMTLLATSILLIGCGSESEPAPEQSADDGGDAPTEPVRDSGREAAPAEVAAEPEVEETWHESTIGFDWDAIDAAGSVQATRALLYLLRDLDVWFEGELDEINLIWREDGYIAIEGQRHTHPMHAPTWKGILKLIPERAKMMHDGVARWRAMPAEHYRDDYGEVTRYNYRFSIISAEELRLVNEGQHIP